MTILIVEDEPSNRHLLRTILTGGAGEDAEILEAGDLTSALDVVKQADVILCDGHFPGGGLQMTAEVSANPWLSVWAYGRHKRFLLLTGDEPTAEYARRLHIATLNKPYDFDAIRRFVFDDVVAQTSASEVCGSAGENPVVVEQNHLNERLRFESAESAQSADEERMKGEI